jgi:hypothetical protein
MPAQAPSACRTRPAIAQRRSDEKRRETSEQHRTPPEAVGNRAVDKLPGANPGEIKANDELHMRRRVGEYRDEQRQGGHDHMQGAERERRYRRQQRK